MPFTCCSMQLFASPYLAMSVDAFIFDYLSNITEVKQVGTFSLQANFNKGAAECGLENEDDDAVLEAQG